MQSDPYMVHKALHARFMEHPAYRKQYEDAFRKFVFWYFTQVGKIV